MTAIIVHNDAESANFGTYFVISQIYFVYLHA